MSYIRTNWVNGETVIDAESLNNIEDWISSFDAMISSGTFVLGTTSFTEEDLIELLSFVDATGVSF